mmetsp:Transcript_1156/g.1966  ORF Transcript_1156/g.1966 Transcript_1156/m.1966 type:complete len:90 (+) Transcript_1156:1-270(+)
MRVLFYTAVAMVALLADEPVSALKLKSETQPHCDDGLATDPALASLNQTESEPDKKGGMDAAALRALAEQEQRAAFESQAKADIAAKAK